MAPKKGVGRKRDDLDGGEDQDAIVQDRTGAGTGDTGGIVGACLGGWQDD